MESNSGISWRGSLQLIFGLGLAYLFYYMMEPFLVAILLGAIIAIISYPLYKSLTRKVPRVLAALMVTVGIVVGVLFPLFLVLYNGAYRALTWIGKINLTASTETAESLVHSSWLHNILTTIHNLVPVDREWLQDQAVQVFGAVLTRLSGMIGKSLAGMPGFLLGFAIVMVSIYFFLVDGDRFLRFLSSLSPMKFEKSYELYSTFEKSCRGVVLGLFASAILQGVLTAFFCMVTGVPNAILLGTMTVMMAMIPLFGSTPITVGATIYLVMQHSPIMAVVMGVGAVLIGLSDNVIRSLVMKGASELHPLLALVSVFGAINLMGATGIFLGPVIAAVFVAFLKLLSQELRREKAPERAGLTT